MCVCLWVSEVKCEEENSSGAEQLVKRERVKSEGGSSSSSDGSSGSSSEEEEEKEKEEGEKYEPDLDLENDFPLGILYWNLYSLVLKLALGHIQMMAHPSYTTHTHTPTKSSCYQSQCLSLPCFVAMELSVTLTSCHGNALPLGEEVFHDGNSCGCVWRGGSSVS